MQNEPFTALSALSSPITEAHPSGTDLRENLSADAPYQKMKALRAKCRAQERSSINSENNENTVKDWKTIITLSATVLNEQAKDLEVTAWLIEGLTRVHGFAGLTQGFETAYTLIESFWPNVYPSSDEDGIQTTLSPLMGLNGERNNGTLITPIHCIPLVNYNGIPLASWQYLQALRATPENTTVENSEEITLKHFEDAAIATGWEKILAQKKSIQHCLDTFEKLCDLLDTTCDRDHSPPNSNIRNALKDALDIINTLSSFAPPPLTEKNQHPLHSGQNIIQTDRQKAFQDLKSIADYFRQTEPNSPVPFLLEQAIRWGNMSLPELLSELVYDEQVLAHTYKLIGVHSVANS